MENGIDIFNRNEYHINKGFHKHVQGPLTYMIKVVGIDCESKSGKKKPKICKEAMILEPNEKFSGLVFMCFLRKSMRRRMRRTEIKRRRYEELEEAI